MRRWMSAALVLLMLAVLAEAASVTVTQIKASGSGDNPQVDPKLSGIAGALTKRFRFAKYEFLSSRSASVNEGGTGTWSLNTGDKLDITFDGVEKSDSTTRYKLTVEIYSEDKSGKRRSTTKISVKNPRGDVWLLGLEQESKGLGWTLILAIKAE